ncbi:MAG: tRNA threonylcarbamoyladenosine dehydratase [Massilia sp.]
MTTITIPVDSVGAADSDPAGPDFKRRFGGIGRLYGEPALERFGAAHVCVIGVGGVGSWIVEALARSAIGRLTLIDLDNVSESNINRQIQATSASVGQAKIDALAERVALINPACELTLVEDFIGADNLEQLLGGQRFDYVVDAIDSARAKAAVISYCRDHKIRLIVIGGAGGQTDPSQIHVRDLNRTEQEPLLKRVRKLLRTHYGYPRGEKHKFHVEAVFSMEPLRFPADDASCSLDADERGVTGLNCAGFGSSVVVTASFGMAAAARVLNVLAADATVAAPSADQLAVQGDGALVS